MKAEGGGCVSTVNDYIKFLEALRKGELLKDETIALMTTGMLSDVQIKDLGCDFLLPEFGYTYGLGVRCPMENSGHTDFGWTGAAGAYMLCDRVNNITMYYAQHVLSAPNRYERYELPGALYEDLKALS